MDNTLHLISDRIRNLDVDGEAVPVREWELRSLLTEREVMPIFERPGGVPVTCIDEDGRSVIRITKPRRVILPMFRYDPSTGLVEGEDGPPTTLDDRMVEIIRVTRVNGYDDIHPDDIRKVEQYVHIHLLLAGFEGHMLGCLPDFDKMPFYFMVRANIVSQSSR